MRKVRAESDSGDIARAENVICVDESGDVSKSGNLATLAVVRCPRSQTEKLAEILIDCGLQPWRAKSRTLSRKIDKSEYYIRVHELITSLSSESIPWRVAAIYDDCTIRQKSAAACTLAKKTMTSVQPEEFNGDSILIPDGNSQMYGNSQSELRKQATQVFDGSFQSVFGEVYVSSMSKADLTYPEGTAADYLAGWVRKQIMDEVGIENLPDEVMVFNPDWCEPDTSPQPLYKITDADVSHGSEQLNRIIAWIMGRNDSGSEYNTSSRLENRLDILQSETVEEYLREFCEE